jgi:hypothetical protein
MRERQRTIDGGAERRLRRGPKPAPLRASQTSAECSRAALGGQAGRAKRKHGLLLTARGTPCISQSMRPGGRRASADRRPRQPAPASRRGLPAGGPSRAASWLPSAGSGRGVQPPTRIPPVTARRSMRRRDRRLLDGVGNATLASSDAAAAGSPSSACQRSLLSFGIGWRRPAAARSRRSARRSMRRADRDLLHLSPRRRAPPGAFDGARRRQIAKSASVFLLAASAALSHLGCRPRPLQAFPAPSRYLTATFLPDFALPFPAVARPFPLELALRSATLNPFSCMSALTFAMASARSVCEAALILASSSSRWAISSASVGMI